METVKILETDKGMVSAIATIARTGKKLDSLIHQTAVSAIYHAQQHGNFQYYTKLYAVMPRSARARALRDWFVKYSPAMFVEKEKVFKKNPAKDAPAFDLDAATATPFWTPEEKTAADFNLDNFLKMVTGKLRKAREKGKVKAADEKRITAEIHNVLTG